MESLLAQFEPQIVHVHGLWQLFALIARGYGKRSRTPYVISPHGMMAGPALKQKSIRKRMARVLYQDGLLHSATCLVATSEIELKDLRRAGFNGPVAVISLGLDEVDPAPLFAERGPKQVIYMGRKAPLKGLERLLAVWGRINSNFPDWTLRIIGPDDAGYETKLQNIIALDKIAGVELVPPVYGTAREAAYCSSQLFVHPSLCDNFALTVGESLVRGVPVIATRDTPWQGLDTYHCGRCIEGDTDSLERALVELMALPSAERFAMGRRGREWILRDFQWPALAERHHELYRWLLGEDERPEFVVTN
jgi:glycosyltransferase involved in cell wall biosynthesis